MKAVGFFLAVFFGMLAVFLVATGEVANWFTSGDPALSVELPPDPSPSTRKNILEFPFWEPKEGRRRFFIRAELSQESLHGTDAIKELEEISLKDGFIAVPFYPSKSADGTAADEDESDLEELVLEFSRAVYRRGDGLASGKKPLSVELWNGKGSTNEGTLFFFEELLFSQDDEDRSRFEILTQKPVSISREPFLQVSSTSGLKGFFSGRGGFENLVFLPPVQTYLSPEAMSLFSKGGSGGSGSPGGRQELAAAPSDEQGRRVAVSCEGALELDFDAPPLRASQEDGPGDEPRRKTRVTFQENVVLYEARGEALAGKPPPAPQGHRFECQKLELEIEDADGQGPYPSYGLATREAGRVMGRFVREAEQYLLEAERLEWFHTPGGQGADPLTFRSEVVLSGQPTLRGKDREFGARRAVWLPRENLLRLEEVEGWLESAVLKRVEHWSLRADEVEVTFTEEGNTGERVLSHFIARSSEPRHVTVETARLDPAAGEADSEEETLARLAFQATGRMLTVQDKTGESAEQVVLEGTPREPPRLSLGHSWIEADKILLFRRERFSRFEGHVRARIEKEDIAASSGQGAAVPPASSEIQADFLELEFSEQKLARAAARGRPAEPVSLLTLDEPRYRLLAPAFRLDAEKSEVELLGGRMVTPADESARIEFDGGEVRAEKIQFEQKSWTCRLESGVDIRLHSSSKDREDRPTLQILARRADVTLFEKRRETAAEGAFGQFEQQVRKLHAAAGDGAPLVVRGRSFVLSGEEVTWDAETAELRFFGRESQRIELAHENLRGPITAREVVYDRATHLLTLRGSVQGQLLQPLVSREGESGPAGKPSPPLLWEFETSVLELEIDESAGAETVELLSLRARDKVTLRNRQYGLKLVGDDLIYEHPARRVRVFSREGRLQKLVHYKPDAGRSPEALEAAGAVNQILAREIWVFHYPGRSEQKDHGAMDQLVLVQFDKVVDATFLVPGDPPETWKLDTAERLTLHLDPRADPATSQILCRAVASGNVVFSSAAYRAEAERAEYEEAERRLSLYGQPVNLIDIQHERRKKADAVTLRKVGDKILVNYEEAQATARPQ
ncbi:MAG: hypothetical protein JXA90_04920 [Planctomycetes bacterium]|nr:hypothetical protein [Planctomycetota bacterium]